MRHKILVLAILLCTLTPTLGAIANEKLQVGIDWHWQLTGKMDAPAGAKLIDIDLFENSSVSIEQYKSNGMFVLCYFSAGTLENWRSDVAGIPKSTLGKPMKEWPDETWWNIADPSVRQLITTRLNLAKQKGCDGVEPDNVDGFENDTGLNITQKMEIDFLNWMASQTHRRGLKIALKNSPALAHDLAATFDLAITEQCFEYDECAQFLPFIKRGKPVLNAEYLSLYKSEPKQLCQESNELKISTLILPLGLDNSFRLSCAP